MTFGREGNEAGPYCRKAIIVAVLIMILKESIEEGAGYKYRSYWGD